MAEVPTATSEGRVFNANYQIKDQHNIQEVGPDMLAGLVHPIRITMTRYLSPQLQLADTLLRLQYWILQSVDGWPESLLSLLSPLEVSISRRGWGLSLPTRPDIGGQVFIISLLCSHRTSPSN